MGERNETLEKMDARHPYIHARSARLERFHSTFSDADRTTDARSIDGRRVLVVIRRLEPRFFFSTFGIPTKAYRSAYPFPMSRRESSSSDRFFSSPSKLPPRTNARAERSPWSIDDDSVAGLFREWTRLRRGTCKHGSYPKRKRNESAVEYQTRVVDVLRDEDLTQACLTSHVARDRNLPKPAREFAEEGLRDMRRRMRAAKKDEILRAYRDLVRKYHDEVRNGVLPRRAHRTFLGRKAKLMDKVRKVPVWDARAFSTRKLARKIVDHSNRERAVSALKGLNRGGLPANMKRLVLNRSNVTHPVRRPSPSSSRTRSTRPMPSPTYGSNGNDDGNLYTMILPGPLTDSMPELQRQSDREFATYLNAGTMPPTGPAHEPTLRRKWDLFSYAQSAYLDLPSSRKTYSTFSNADDLVRYVRAHAHSNDPTWTRLRKFVLAIERNRTSSPRTRS